jgi:hypothetical protein
MSHQPERHRYCLRQKKIFQTIGGRSKSFVAIAILVIVHLRSLGGINAETVIISTKVGLGRVTRTDTREDVTILVIRIAAILVARKISSPPVQPVCGLMNAQHSEHGG